MVNVKTSARNRNSILKRNPALPYIFTASVEKSRNPETSITARLPSIHGRTSRSSSDTGSSGNRSPSKRIFKIKIVPPSTPSASRWYISTNGNSHTESRIPCPKNVPLHHSQNDIRVVRIHVISGGPPHGGGSAYAIARPAATIATHSTIETMPAILAARGVLASKSHSAVLRPIVELKIKTFTPASTNMIIFTLKNAVL